MTAGQTPEGVIRSYLEERGPTEVPVSHLCTTWGVAELGARERELIAAALAGVGISVSPPLHEVDPGGRVALSLAPQQHNGAEAVLPRDGQQRPCPRCGSPTGEGRYCLTCGLQLPEPTQPPTGAERLPRAPGPPPPATGQPRRLHPAVLVAVGAALLAAAVGLILVLVVLPGGTEKLDRDKVTAQVRSQVEQALRGAGPALAPLRLDSVRCPADVGKGKGKRFECQITLRSSSAGSLIKADGEPIKLTNGKAQLTASVTQKDDQGNVTTSVQLPTAVALEGSFATRDATYTLTSARTQSQYVDPSYSFVATGKFVVPKLRIDGGSRAARERAANTQKVNFTLVDGQGNDRTATVSTARFGGAKATMALYYDVPTAAVSGSKLRITTQSGESGLLDLRLR